MEGNPEPPPPQYPVPPLTEEDPAPEVEQLEAPWKKARILMAEHVRGHGINAFRVERHVHLGGPRALSQLLTWNPGKATFTCQRCPGELFWTGEFTAELVESAQLWDEGLKPHLAGLSDAADRDEMTRRYLDGTLNRERLRSLRGADARRRAAAGSRPSVEHRRKVVQTWMLERARARGIVERVLEEAERMQKSDPQAWAKLSERALSKETLRDYWQDIPPEVRAAARAAGLKARKKST